MDLSFFYKAGGEPPEAVQLEAVAAMGPIRKPALKSDPRDVEVLDVIRIHPGITRASVARILGRPKSSTDKAVMRLVSEGKVAVSFPRNAARTKAQCLTAID